MRKLRKTLIQTIALVTAALTMMAFAGCEGSDLSGVTKTPLIKVIVKNSNYDYWSVVKLGAEAAGKEFGVNVEYEGPTDERDIEGQIKMVQEAIDQNADAIVLAASDYLKLVDVVEKAASVNIPVIIIDSELKSDMVKSFIGTDNVIAGNKLGEALVQKVGEKCSIGIMNFVKGAGSAVQREQGLLETLGKHKDIKILDKEYCSSSESLAQQLTEKIIKENPDIDAMVCLNANATVGTSAAIEKLGLTGKVKVIGFDSIPEEVSYMEKGTIQALVIQKPFNMGYQGVKYAYEALQGRNIPSRIDTGSTVIDMDNMYLPENQKLVFPFAE